MKALPKTSLIFKTVLGASSLALITGLSTSAIAQTAGTANSYEDVVVATGSVIRSRAKDFETPSPVQTVDKTTFDQTGAIQIQDVFKGISANAGSELASDVTTRQGTSQFSLRGLGLGSTLTLINGRRA